MKRRWKPPGPMFLEASAQVRVRFQEVDMLGVVWHGHYLSYFEEGRLAFGKTFGMEYQQVAAEGILIPLVHVELDYLAPAKFGDELKVRTRLHPEEAARLTFSYRIQHQEGPVLARGLTVQAFTDRQGTLLLKKPAYYERFLARWEQALQSE